MAPLTLIFQDKPGACREDGPVVFDLHSRHDNKYHRAHCCALFSNMECNSNMANMAYELTARQDECRCGSLQRFAKPAY